MTDADFWAASVLDVLLYIDAVAEEEKRREKEDILRLFLQARINAAYIADVFNGKSDAPTPWQVFPTLFEDEAAEEEQVKQDFYIDQLKARAEQWNKRRK